MLRDMNKQTPQAAWPGGTSKPTPYRYSKLAEDDSFRLLRVRSTTTACVTELPKQVAALGLESHHLASAPVFQTVSYTWGTQSLNESLLLDDTTAIPVTQSLALALPFLLRACSCDYLWIDEICVNQEDLLERSHQVDLMGDIYRRASNVLIWLGLYCEGETLRKILDRLSLPTGGYKLSQDVERVRLPPPSSPEHLSLIHI